MTISFVIDRLGLFQRHRSVDHELAGRAGDRVRGGWLSCALVLTPW
jgi:hypothetical protein